MASVSTLKRSAFAETSADKPAAHGPPAAAPPPLRAWRLRQRVTVDARTRATRTMNVADAAAAFSAFAGRPVAYQTWRSWEQPQGSSTGRDPSGEYKRLLFLFTGGEIRPDHAYPIDEWRAELAALPRCAAGFQDGGG